MTYKPRTGDWIMDSDTHTIIGRYVDGPAGAVPRYDKQRVEVTSAHSLYGEIGRGDYDRMNQPIIVSRLGRHYRVFHAIHHPQLGLILEVGARELTHCTEHKHFSLSCLSCIKLNITPQEK